jgi:membrane-bound lytic murein transglycosylase MltF
VCLGRAQELTELMNELNRWIAEKQNTALFDRLYQKYFVDRRRYLERVTSEYLTSTTGIAERV